MTYSAAARRMLAGFLGVFLLVGGLAACDSSSPVTPDAVSEFMEVAWDVTPSDDEAVEIAEAVEAELERREAEAEQLERFYEAAAAYDAEQARLAAMVPAGTTERQWQVLRNCESGDRPGAVSASGKYRGLYQFDYRTWQSVGGSGDPAAASRAEQNKRAYLLYESRGWYPWPHCGMDKARYA